MALLATCEAHAVAACAHEAQSGLSPEEALYRYYQPLFAKAGLAYTPPAQLWVDDVTLESVRYQRWASYYASNGGSSGGTCGGQPPAPPPPSTAPSISPEPPSHATLTDVPIS